ncbi:hypothetical protein HMPREF9946_01391 [Acetobacteraceae bacterium AT-5844]|nr:hypothetical protein HMPREF9946_01391 [Acetobacteraceae bacterium AT-5844]
MLKWLAVDADLRRSSPCIKRITAPETLRTWLPACIGKWR